jgi:hypothetical protein
MDSGGEGVRRRIPLAVAPLVIGVACGTSGAAVAQTSSGEPLTTSVSVKMISTPRAYTDTISPRRRSTNDVAFRLVAACVQAPVGEGDDSLVFERPVAKVWTAYSADPVLALDDHWHRPCGESFSSDGRLLGETWTTESRLYRAPASITLSQRPHYRFAPIRVSFQGGYVQVQVSVRRAKSYRFRWVQQRRYGSYTVRIWSDTNFDRYVNICIERGYRIRASGGRLYCSVTYDYTYRKRVRVPTRAKVRWSVAGLRGFATASFHRTQTLRAS